MNNTKKEYDVSIIVTVTEYCSDIGQMYAQFSDKLKELGKSFECIFVQSFQNSQMTDKLKAIMQKHPNISVLLLRSSLTEADAFSIGVQHASGKLIFTLPVYHQIDHEGLNQVFEPIEKKYDLVACYRYPRKDSWLNQLESRIFNGLIRRLLNVQLNDLGCGVMLMTREVAESLDLYGDLFRFLPVLALRQGFRVGEIKVTHLPRRKKSGVYGLGVYLRRLLDIFTLFFIVKFTKKPLRFFGLAGALFFFIGVLINVYLAVDRLLGHALANRPMLVLGVVSMVLGIQLLSIGLIGELIIFIHARKLKEYKIERIIG